MLICRPHKLVTVVMLFIISFSASAARLAIVIDDFGYRVKEDNQILALPVGSLLLYCPIPHMDNKLRKKPISKDVKY